MRLDHVISLTCWYDMPIAVVTQLDVFKDEQPHNMTLATFS